MASNSSCIDRAFRYRGMVVELPGGHTQVIYLFVILSFVQTDYARIHCADQVQFDRIEAMTHEAVDAVENRGEVTLYMDSRINIHYPSDRTWTNYSYNAFYESVTPPKSHIYLKHDFKDWHFLHEWGHYIQIRLANRDPYLPCSVLELAIDHSVDDLLNEGIALMEGFADFFPCWVRDNPDMIARRTGGNIEDNSAWVTGSEMEVASLLWDYTDPENDDAYSDHSALLFGLLVWKPNRYDLMPDSIDFITKVMQVVNGIYPRRMSWGGMRMGGYNGRPDKRNCIYNQRHVYLR